MSARDLLPMLRDAVDILSGRGYFHAEQGLGLHWEDPRCYYNDLQSKSEWEGRTRDGIPLLYVPRLGGDVIFPIMVLQFGLGSLDMALTTGRSVAWERVEVVYRWLADTLSAADCFDNMFPAMDPENVYTSANSAMAQGQALSFLSRVVRNAPERCNVEASFDAMDRIWADMQKPVADGGTVRLGPDGPMYSETCRGQGHVVYNGWVFALFGLRDYAEVRPGPAAEAAWNEAEEAFASSVGAMLLDDGWSVYDTDGNVASPFYQRLHIALLEAMSRLTGRDSYARVVAELVRGWRPSVRLKRTFQKAVIKLRQRRMYTGER